MAAWRKQLRKARDQKFNELVEKTLAAPDPRGTVKELLSKGPISQFQGQKFTELSTDRTVHNALHESAQVRQSAEATWKVYR